MFDAQVTEEKHLLTSIVRNTQGAPNLWSTPYCHPQSCKAHIFCCQNIIFHNSSLQERMRCWARWDTNPFNQGSKVLTTNAIPNQGDAEDLRGLWGAEKGLWKPEVPEGWQDSGFEEHRWTAFGIIENWNAHLFSSSVGKREHASSGGKGNDHEGEHLQPRFLGGKNTKVAFVKKKFWWEKV